MQRRKEAVGRLGKADIVTGPRMVRFADREPTPSPKISSAQRLEGDGGLWGDGFFASLVTG